MKLDDILNHNREAWDQQVKKGNRWTLPVSPEVIAAARKGQVELLLTPSIPVPPEWYPPLTGIDILCLASGGGQQGPVLAAAGARVTVFDNSPRQLAQDRMVAEREGLELNTLEGDMRDLSIFPDDSFDLIFHPVSNVFIPNILPVWAEAYRVLRPGGSLLAGVTNPLMYLFDTDLMENDGILEVKHRIPYSDLESLSDSEKEEYRLKGWPMEFSHTLDEQIGGQIDAGFLIAGFYEDRDPGELLDEYIATFIGLRSIKPEKNQPETSLSPTVNDFAFRLAAVLFENDQGGIFFSPYSIAAALTMTANGAQYETLEAMLVTLGLNNQQLNVINQAHRSLHNNLETSGGQNKIAVANGLWGQHGLGLKVDFIQRCSRYFDAEVSELDFFQSESLDIINNWVAEKTEHKIKDLLKPGDLGPLTILVLINAIYFKGIWHTQFDPERTEDGDFSLLDGSTISIPMMRQSGKFPYYRGQGFQALNLPYVGERISIYLFLPDQTLSLADFQKQLNIENWDYWVSQLSPTDIDIVLPRFKQEYEFELSRILSQMGMGIVFGSNANFGGICEDSASISQVRHKAFILVDEQGSEAAAATAVIMARSALSAKPKLEFNRPFFYAICDKQTGVILFMGALVDPN